MFYYYIAIANSADPDKSLRSAAFQLCLAVCQSTSLGVSNIQRVKDNVII